MHVLNELIKLLCYKIVMYTKRSLSINITYNITTYKDCYMLVYSGSTTAGHSQ